MDFFGGSNFKPDTSDEVLIAQAKLAKKNIADIQTESSADYLAALKKQEAEARFAASPAAEKAEAIKRAIAQRGKVGFEVGRAAGVGMRQQVDFSEEQRMLQQMFGHGGRIWGTNNEPVRINNDLNSSRSDPFDETSSMFGFGDQRERSGLF